jgi:hypothetical protein
MAIPRDLCRSRCDSSDHSQVEAIVWRYVGNAYRKAGLPRAHHLDAKW